MKYEFSLEEYWDIMDIIHERNDVENFGFKQIKIAEEKNSELYVYGYRIFIPELNMTVREGMEYYKDSDDEEQPIDSFIMYEGNEKDPNKFTASYCNTFLPSLIGMIASDRKLNTNPRCYIDDSEFELWEN